MRGLVRAGNVAGAKSRADDLETAWDRGQARMKPMNPGKWTSMDNAIDDVLTTTRASPPNAAGSGAALDALVAMIDTFDKAK